MQQPINPNEHGLDEQGLSSLFPGEVVTRALVRDVQLPGGAGTMALITLDNGHDHTRPNTFGPAGLISLRDALEEVAGRDDIAAVGVTGKPFIFAAGADLTGAARPVTKVGVVGAGLMAAQIALLFARRLEVPVVLTDLDQARLDAGVGHVHGEIAKLAGRGRISADAAAKLTGLVAGSLTKDAFADADFVIEAVFEEIPVKQRVFAEVEAVVRPDCVLATNTSSLSLSVTEMASGLAHPERVVGFHFFNPVAMMPLVEVVRAAATEDFALATALAVGKSLKKNCVLVKDTPAFVVNRLLTRFLGEIIACVDEGTPFEVAEHAPDPLGLPLSPFFLLQLVGPAVALHVGETLHAAYPRPRTRPSPAATVARGPRILLSSRVSCELFTTGRSSSAMSYSGIKSVSPVKPDCLDRL